MTTVGYPGFLGPPDNNDIPWYPYYILLNAIIEGSLEVKLPTIWTVEKAEVRRVRRDKIRRKKMQMREKVGKSRNTVFFQ
jgi:hypothetical protein